MMVRDGTILQADHVDGNGLGYGGGCPTVVPPNTTQRHPKQKTLALNASKQRSRIQVGEVMKNIPASLPAGEVLAAGPASALSVLSASASLSLKHRLQNNMNICRV